MIIIDCSTDTGSNAGRRTKGGRIIRNHHSRRPRTAAGPKGTTRSLSAKEQCHDDDEDGIIMIGRQLATTTTTMQHCSLYIIRR